MMKNQYHQPHDQLKIKLWNHPPKNRLKDQRSPIRPPTSTHSSANKKTLKNKQKLKLKLQETENIETLNKSRQLEKMELENSPQETKTKSPK